MLILDYFTLESEISTDSFDDNLDNETLYERICALQDIIPAQSRHKISNAFSSFSSFAKSTISFGGSALWVVSTSAFLLGVPWALALAEEQQYVQMEREQGMTKGANEVRVWSIDLAPKHCVMANLIFFLLSTDVDSWCHKRSYRP